MKKAEKGRVFTICLLLKEFFVRSTGFLEKPTPPALLLELLNSTSSPIETPLYLASGETGHLPARNLIGLSRSGTIMKL